MHRRHPVVIAWCGALAIGAFALGFALTTAAQVDPRTLECDRHLERVKWMEGHDLLAKLAAHAPGGIESLHARLLANMATFDSLNGPMLTSAEQSRLIEDVKAMPDKDRISVIVTYVKTQTTAAAPGTYVGALDSGVSKPDLQIQDALASYRRLLLAQMKDFVVQTGKNKSGVDELSDQGVVQMYRRSVRERLACGVLAATGPGAADPQFEVVWVGIYKSLTGGRERAPEAPGGARDVVVGTRFERATTSIPAERGVSFGVGFRFHDASPRMPVDYQTVWRFPSPGLADPQRSSPILEYRAMHDCRGGLCVAGWQLQESWEIVPGTWTVEIWRDDRKLHEQSFEIRP